MTDVPSTAQEPRPGYRAVLANTEFRALWFAHVTSVLGDQLTRIVLASVVLARTGSVTLSALSFATTYLPWLLGGPLLSLFADRCPRRTVMVACDVARGLLVLAMVVPGTPIWGLFVLASLVALLGPPFEAARGATVPEVLPAPLYPVAQALSMASLQAAQLLGFALGGLLVTLQPGAWVLALDAATFLLSAAVLQRYVAWRPGADDAGELTARSWARDSTQGLRLVVRTPDLRRLLGLSTLVAAVTVLPESLAIAQADALGRTPFVAGLLCAALPFGTVLGAAFAGRPSATRDRLSLVRPLGLLACASSAACLLEPGLAGLIVLWVLAGVGAGGLLPANVAFVLRVAPALRGRALSVAQVVLQVGQGLAVAGGGVLAGTVGPAAAVGWAGVLGLVSVGAMCLRWPESLRSTEPGVVVEEAARGGVLSGRPSGACGSSPASWPRCRPPVVGGRSARPAPGGPDRRAVVGPAPGGRRGAGRERPLPGPAAGPRRLAVPPAGAARPGLHRPARLRRRADARWLRSPWRSCAGSAGSSWR